MAGGSAGAICWFDGGHSDSMDPSFYFKTLTDESAAAALTLEKLTSWKYIRVPCLGFLPGLVCPHFDKTQSNGTARAADFDEMMRRHPGETGVGIDHFAALVVEGNRYSVLSAFAVCRCLSRCFVCFFE